MKNQRLILITSLLLVVMGSILPLYKLDTLYDFCSTLTIFAILFNSTIAIYLYNKNMLKLIILPQIITTVYFIIIWSDILDKFAIMNDLNISYKYCIGFYLILIGLVASLIQCIVYLSKKEEKKRVQVKYITNKKTGSIERKEIS